MKKSNIKLFHNKDFLLLFLGGFVSRIGNGIHYIALVWFVLDITGSGSATGLVLLLSTLPGVIFGPFSGVIADKFDRRKLIILMDILRGLVVLWLGYYIYIGIANFFHISLATILIAICTSLFNPALTASIPNIVADNLLQKANSLNYFSLNFTQIIGAAVGGILIAAYGISGVFFINGVSFLISAFSELFINIPKVKIEKEMKKSHTILNEIKFGLNFLWVQKEIVSLFTVAIFLNFLFTGLMMLGIPYIFKELLRVNSMLYGYAQSVFPAGAVIGSIILSQIPEIRNYYKVLLYSLNIQSLLLLGMGLPLIPYFLINTATMKIYYLIMLALFIIGIFNAVINVPIRILLQRLIPDNLRGRITGLLSTMTQALVPISVALTGYLLDILPVYTLFLGGGVLASLLTLYIAKIPSMQKLDYTKNNSSKQVELSTNIPDA
ncbi:MAG: MFS transporter [Halanaerobiales bacterium]